MKQITSEVLVIGAGAAGVRAAVAAAEAGAEVTLVARAAPGAGGSSFNRVCGGWGIQALMGAERTPAALETFFDEIIAGGLGRCDPTLARILVEESGARLADLIKWGVRFRRQPDGTFVRATGCFSFVPRAYMTDGLASVRRAFLSICRRHAVRIVTGQVADLAVADGGCHGAWLMQSDGTLLQIQAGATVMAAGGGAALFEDHMATAGQGGDGIAMAARAGADLHNLEFIQFMLGTKAGGQRGFVALETLDRPGAIRDSQGADILAAAFSDAARCATALAARQTHLPFSCRDAGFRIDQAVARCRTAGGPVFWHSPDGPPPVPVVHYAHAFNGGVRIDPGGATSLPGLYAAGEAAAGPHGADRLGGAMLAATQVFGARAGAAAGAHARKLSTAAFPIIAPPDWLVRAGRATGWHLNPIPAAGRLVARIKAVTSAHAALIRHDAGLRQARVLLADCRGLRDDLLTAGRLSPLQAVRTRNMLDAARALLRAIDGQPFSLGSHLRQDFPPPAGV